MVELTNPKIGEKMADLGSGDGRILLAFARMGIEAHGFELDLNLIQKSQDVIGKEKCKGKIYLWEKDFWNEDLSQFDIITIYPMPDIMKQLEEKVQNEAHRKSRIAVNFYPFPNLKPIAVKNNIYLYQISNA